MDVHQHSRMKLVDYLWVAATCFWVAVIVLSTLKVFGRV